MDISERAELLVRAGFDLSADDAAALAGDLHERALDVGEFLFHEGDPGNALFVIGSGTLEAVTSSRDGRELVFRSMGPDSIIGELTIIEGQARSAGIRATRPSVVACIDRATFLAHAERRPAVGLALAELCARRARDLSQWVSTAAFATAPSRLAGALLTLTAATPDGDDIVRITQQALGDRLGISRETTNKWLRVWKRDGLVRLGRSTVTILDHKALEAIALA